MRVARGSVDGQSYQLEERAHALAALLSRPDVRDREPLADDARHAHAGIQRAVRILEDDLHRAPHGAQLAGTELEERASVEAHIAGGRLDQPQDQAAEGGLAATGLAHQPEGLPRGDLDGDVLDRPPDPTRAAEQPTPGGEVLAQRACLD